jgi:predicted phage tail component-like protein
MIYAYEDTPAVVNPTPATLPAEAVSLNGTFLENIIQGYRTLYVKGRESLGIDLNTYSVGVADGEKVKGSRYPARVLTIGFQLLCPTDEDFRLRFNQLNNILSIDEADFVFNDEADKYFTGYPVMDASVEAGRNNVTGEWKIYCAYPFKRSVAVRTLSSTDEAGVVIGNNSATFTFDYKGVIPAKPVLRCEFASAREGGDFNEDGDCGFVAFLNPDENIIQLGNPDVIDVDVLNKNGTLANSEFDVLTDWTASGISVGSITDTYWAKGTGQTLNYARGTGTLSRSTAGAVGFEFDIVHRLAVSAPSQVGSFQAHLKNGNKVIVGFEIVKTGNGTAGTVNYIINDKVVGTDSIDISYYNTSFGYCNRTPVYVQETYYEQVVTYVKQTYKKKGKKKKKTVPIYSWEARTRTVQNGWNYTQSNLNSGISRDGSVVTFSVGNLPDRTFKDSDIELTPVYDVVFTYTGSFHTNALRSASLIRKAGVPFAEIPNVFTAGDIVEADCNNANVYLYRNGSLEGHLEPQYGALGNDWEDFEIKVGQNIIRAVWSDWVDPNYKPVVKILFNEVYI